MGFWSTLANIGNGIWNAITGVVPVVNAGVATYDQIKTNELNNEIIRENNRINELNYQLQRDNLDYQKSLQKTIFGREDTSVQRKVADLKAAGLSPTLAAGSGASAGSVVSTSAPHMGKRELKLQSLAALANVQTMIANQQKAQTEADIARQHLKQSELDTKYLEDRGLAPLEVNQDWKSRLLNLLYPKMEDALFGEDTKSNLFGGIVQSLVDDLSDRPSSGVTVDSQTGNIVNKSGQSLTNGQVSLLKQKGLYREWLAVGFSPNVVKALRGN